ncbi:MAG: phenylalanine--tRNA ligase beta subunit-related protein [Candidatus Hadarchaeota archaeon]
MLKMGEELQRRFPGLAAQLALVEGVTVEREKAELQEFKRQVEEEVKKSHDLATIKDHPLMRAYRDFYWRIEIDPTKDRPAAEALVRRVLAGKPLPTINTFVDAYNLASVKSFIPMGAFDADKITGELLLRPALAGEEFLGIGMQVPQLLKGNEPVVADEEKLIAVYPYRDAESTKITASTKNVLLMICGVPGVETAKLEKALGVAVDIIARFCGGRFRD